MTESIAPELASDAQYHDHNIIDQLGGNLNDEVMQGRMTFDEAAAYFGSLVTIKTIDGHNEIVLASNPQ